MHCSYLLSSWPCSLWIVARISAKWWNRSFTELRITKLWHWSLNWYCCLGWYWSLNRWLSLSLIRSKRVCHRLIRLPRISWSFSHTNLAFVILRWIFCGAFYTCPVLNRWLGLLHTILVHLRVHLIHLSLPLLFFSHWCTWLSLNHSRYISSWSANRLLFMEFSSCFLRLSCHNPRLWTYFALSSIHVCVLSKALLALPRCRHICSYLIIIWCIIFSLYNCLW